MSIRRGDPDLVLAGTRSSVGDVAEIYRNDGHDLFTLVPLAVPGFRRGSLDLGDFGGDGDPRLRDRHPRPGDEAHLPQRWRHTFTDTGAPPRISSTGAAPGATSTATGISMADRRPPTTRAATCSRGSTAATAVTSSRRRSRCPAPAGQRPALGDVDDDGDPDFAVTALRFGQSDVLQRRHVVRSWTSRCVTCAAARSRSAMPTATVIWICCSAALGSGPETAKPIAIGRRPHAAECANGARGKRARPRRRAELAAGGTWRPQHPGSATTCAVGTTPGGLDVVSPMADSRPAGGWSVDPRQRGSGPVVAPAWTRERNLLLECSVDRPDVRRLAVRAGRNVHGRHGRRGARRPRSASHHAAVREPAPRPRNDALRAAGATHHVSRACSILAGRRVATLAEGARAAGVQSVE